MAALGDLVVNLSANTAMLSSGLSRATGMLSNWAKSAGGMVSGALSRMMSFKGLIAGFGGAAGVGGLVKMAADVETLGVQFRVLTGSAETAAALMSDIRTFAAETPFESGEIAEAARSLVAFGTPAEQAVGTLRMLGDVAAGVGMPLGELAEIYGKAQVQGRLFGEDINQLTGRGIPVISALASTMGVAESEVKKLVEAGKVGFPQLQTAFQSMTADGGQFNGLMEQLSGTTAGKFSTFVDNVKQLGVTIGTALLPIANELLDWAIGFGPQMATIGKVLAVLAQNLGLTFGTMWETVVDYSTAALNYIIDAAAVMVQNIGIQVSNMLASVEASSRQLGEELAYALGLSDEVLQIGPALQRQTLEMPAFITPELGPAGAQLADKIAEAMMPEPVPIPLAEKAAAAPPVVAEPPTPDKTMQPQLTAAMEQGSAEAYSAIVQAMNRSGDPQVNAVNKMNANLGNKLDAIIEKPAAEFQVVEALI